MDELYHYGILGQKWGVRRYRNRDGTLTTAGKKRYGIYNKNTKSEYTDEELMAKIKRLELEKKYIETLKSSQNIDSGKRDVEAFLKKYGLIIGAATGTIGLLMKIRDYNNKGAKHSDSIAEKAKKVVEASTQNDSGKKKNRNLHTFSSIYNKIKDKSLDEVVDQALTNNMDGILDAIEDGLN